MNKPHSSTRSLFLNLIEQDTALKAISQITENYGDVPAPGLPATCRHVPAQFGKGGSSMTRSEARQEDSMNEDSARPELGVNPSWRHDLARMEGFGDCESGESGCFGVFWPVEVTLFRVEPEFCHHREKLGMFLPHDIAIVR